MTIEHLTYKTINSIALGLDEDVYGSSGELDREEIHNRLIENIQGATGYAYEDGMLPIGVVANLIRGVLGVHGSQVHG